MGYYMWKLRTPLRAGIWEYAFWEVYYFASAIPALLLSAGVTCFVSCFLVLVFCLLNTDTEASKPSNWTKLRSDSRIYGLGTTEMRSSHNICLLHFWVLCTGSQLYPQVSFRLLQWSVSTGRPWSCDVLASASRVVQIRNLCLRASLQAYSMNMDRQGKTSIDWLFSIKET